MANPRLRIDLEKIVHNTRRALAIGREHGFQVMGVTKGAAGLPAVAEAMLAGGAEALGDSRLDNIERMRRAGIHAHMTLLRSPGPSDIRRTVELADASLNVDSEVVAALSQEACSHHKTHEVVLMVDLDTGREGFAPEQVPTACREAASLPGIRLLGIGAYFHLGSDSVSVLPPSRLAMVMERTGRTSASSGSGVPRWQPLNAAPKATARPIHATRATDDVPIRFPPCLF